MTFFLVAALVLAGIGALAGIGIGALTRRRSAPIKLTTHLVLLAVSLVPIAVHVRAAAHTAATFGEPALEPMGMLPVLKSAIVATFVLLAVLFAVGAIITRVVPVFTAAIPAAAFTAYYLFILPKFSELPVLVPLDNGPVAWLFAWEAGLTVLLAAHAIAGNLRSHEASNADAAKS